MMRRIVGTIFQTLDGVIQGPGGATEDYTGGFDHGGWQMGHQDDQADAVLRKAFVTPFALLLGRRTYEIFAAYWPYVRGDIGEAFTNADKHVLTRGNDPLEWENSHRVPSIAAIAELRRQDGPELRIWGSSTLYPQLLEAGLLDELNLFTFPLILGTGKRLFGAGTPPCGFEIVESGFGNTGVSWAKLTPGAPIPKSAPHLPPTNPRDDERQRAMREGCW